MWKGPKKRLSHLLFISISPSFPFSPSLLITFPSVPPWTFLSSVSYLFSTLSHLKMESSTSRGNWFKTKLLQVCLTQHHHLWMLVLAPGCILVQIFAHLVHLWDILVFWACKHRDERERTVADHSCPHNIVGFLFPTETQKRNLMNNQAKGDKGTRKGGE